MKESVYPGRNQIIVYAEDCQHAQQLANDFKKFGFKPEEVDWVGTGPNGRSSKENSDVLDRFLCRCAYSKLKTPILKCLIQVQKAAEGFNCIRASILVFLNALSGDCVIFDQMTGRGSRRDYIKDKCHPGEPTKIDYCDIICSSDFPQLPRLRGMVVEQDLNAGDADKDFDAEQKETILGAGRESPVLFSIPDLMTVDNVNYIGTEVIYCDGLEFNRREILERLHECNPDVPLAKLEHDVVNIINDLVNSRKQVGEGKHVIELHIKSEHEQLEEIKAQLHTAVKQFTGNVVRILYAPLGKIYGDIYGDVMKRINSHIQEMFGGWRDELTISQCKDAYAYIKQANNTLFRSKKAEDVPLWARL